MRSVAQHELLALVRGEDGAGGAIAAVERLRDGTILKLFRAKRGLTSSMLRSYARRFVRSAGRLRAVGVPTIEVLDVFRVTELGREAVIYRPLPGTDLRRLAAGAPFPEEALAGFARFMATLHDRGVYFRGLHMGNVIVGAADGECGYGLIDVTDLAVGPGPLGPARRVRNFRPMLRYPEDRGALERFGPARFLDAYLGAARLDDAGRAAVARGLRAADPLFAGANAS